jgi:plastocyanin
VLQNEGVEAHFLGIVKLAEGVTLEQFMSAEDSEGMTEGEWGTRIASAGDEEAITFDVEPGTYGLFCFLPTVDGTPHAMLGMVEEITVT